MAIYCTSCGKKFESDEQHFCPYCGATRPVEQPKTVVKTPLQVDPKRVRVDETAAVVAPKKDKAPRKSRFWFWLAVVVIAVAAVGCFFPASRVPFQRLFAGEPFSVVFDGALRPVSIGRREIHPKINGAVPRETMRMQKVRCLKAPDFLLCSAWRSIIGVQL